MTEPTQELERRSEGSELVNRRLEAGLAEGNGVIDPARWQMLAAIAETVAGTEFVPKDLRDSSKKTLACLLYGDALGLQPMTSLKEIHVIDGVPGLSAAAMAALVRKAHPGHRMRREELRDSEQHFLGVKAYAERGDTGETDEYSFTLEMASRANLMNKANWQRYPEAMCTARAYSQLCTFLFPDVFMGSPYVPEELEALAADEPAAELVEPGHVVVAVPDPDRAAEVMLDHPPGHVPEPKANQIAWEVKTEDGEQVAVIDADDRRIITDGRWVRFPGTETKYEIVGYDVDGDTGLETVLVRAEPLAAGKAEPGTPAAVVEETIPRVFDYVAQARARGDVGFIRGVLDAEKSGKNRQRLVSQLEEQIATIEAEALKETLAGDGTGPDNPLLGEEPLEGAHEHPDEPEAELDAEPGEVAFAPEEPAAEDDVGARAGDPEIPFASLQHGAQVVRLAALCAYMEDQRPNSRAWHLAGVIGAGSRQFGINAHVLADFTSEQLTAIWKAAEQHAADGVQFLALASPEDVAKMGGAA